MASKAASKASSTKRERMEAREGVIVEAAKKVFVKNGIDGTRMSEIAAKANVAEGTLYLYFKNKTALLSAVVASHWEGLTEGTVAAVDGIDDVFEALHALANYHLKTIIADSALLELNFHLRHATGGVDQSRVSKRAYVVVFDQIFLRGVDRGELRKDVPLWQARDLFFGTLEYSSRTVAYHKRPGEGEAAVESLMSIFKRGLTTVAENTPTSDNADFSTSDLIETTKRLQKIADQLERAKT